MSSEARATTVSTSSAAATGSTVSTISTVSTVSIVIPCREEARYIGQCLDSIVASDFPKDRLEVFVVDGMSQDGTREVVAGYSRAHPFIRLLDNPRRITPVAFNTGIAASTGDLVMIMSAHATYAPDAISKCVRYSQEYSADNVGGIWQVEPRGDSLLDRAVVAALSHPFGVGGASYRTRRGGAPCWVDTAAYGCYRRSVFDRIGLFNEALVRSQDMELNQRLKAAGGRTLLAPDVVVRYFARSDFLSFVKHNFRNGLWAVLPFLHSKVMPVAWRHLAPGAFVAALAATGALSLLWPLWPPAFAALAAFALVAGSYLIASLAASAHVALERRDARFLAVMPLAFAGLHLPYGLGSLWGLVNVALAVTAARRRGRAACGQRAAGA
ncbi:MAG: glycosyltransferase family 2 protein [Planctomycetes bacterium]|nr:glycosyltransferase family 2 protein [Planctomycetota bacterium]